jgi:hypothetical protein
MSDDEIDFTEAKPTTAQKTVEFFEKPIKEAVKEPLPGPESVDELAETPMAWNELCEGMLRELHICVEKRKFYKDREDELRADTKKFVGLDRGMIQRGAYGVEVKETSTPDRTDWVGFTVVLKAWAEEHMGKEGRAEVEKMLANNTTKGGKTLKLSPYKIGSEPKDD